MMSSHPNSLGPFETGSMVSRLIDAHPLLIRLSAVVVAPFNWISRQFLFSDVLKFSSMQVLVHLTNFAIFNVLFDQAFATEKNSSGTLSIVRSLAFVAYTTPVFVGYLAGTVALNRARDQRVVKGSRSNTYTQLALSYFIRWLITMPPVCILAIATTFSVSSLFDSPVKGFVERMMVASLARFALPAYLLYLTVSSLLILTKHYKTMIFSALFAIGALFASRSLFFPDDEVRVKEDYENYMTWMLFPTLTFSIVGSLLFYIFNKLLFFGVTRREFVDCFKVAWGDIKSVMNIVISVFSDTFFLQFLGHVLLFGFYFKAEDFAALTLYNLYQFFLLVVVGASLQMGVLHSISEVNFEAGALQKLKIECERATSLTIVDSVTFENAVTEFEGQFWCKTKAALFALSILSLSLEACVLMPFFRDAIAEQYSEGEETLPLLKNTAYLSLNILAVYFWAVNNVCEAAANAIKKSIAAFSRINMISNVGLVLLSWLAFEIFGGNPMKRYQEVLLFTTFFSAFFGAKTLLKKGVDRRSDRSLIEALLSVRCRTFLAKPTSGVLDLSLRGNPQAADRPDDGVAETKSVDGSPSLNPVFSV